MIESIALKPAAHSKRQAPNSRYCAVLGHPIAHSLSPVLHQAAYRALGLEDWVYERIDVRHDELPQFLASRDRQWVGLSLTMPLKRAIMNYGKSANTWAVQLGNANTAVFTWDDETLVPDVQSRAAFNDSESQTDLALYNTDVDGIVGAIARHRTRHAMSNSDKSSHTALIIGNGNTALSAVAACTTFSDITELVIAARRPHEGEPIRAFLARRAPQFHVCYVDLDQVLRLLPDAAIAVSTLPAHAADGIAAALRESGHAATGVLLDVAYDPRPSLLNQVWSQAGGISITGDEMLLYQAIPQVQIMTRRWCEHFDRDRVEQAMRQALREVLA